MTLLLKHSPLIVHNTSEQLDYLNNHEVMASVMLPSRKQDQPERVGGGFYVFIYDEDLFEARAVCLPLEESGLGPAGCDAAPLLQSFESVLPVSMC